jgi:signal transduction histidine kinase
MKVQNKGILFQLWTGMMALVIVVLVLLWLFQIVFLEQFYTVARISDIKSKGVSLSQLKDTDNINERKEEIDLFAFINNLSIEWLSVDGNVIYATGNMDSAGMSPMMKNSTRIRAFQYVIDGKDVNFPLTHPRFGNEFVLIGLPVLFSGEVSGVLLINIPMAPVEETTAILKRQLFYITLGLLAASLIISFVISRRFTGPILAIKKVSEKLAAGNFMARINSNRQDEIGQLAATINYMGTQLSRIEQLRRDLIANVSHELRTPLSLIRGYAETIRDISGSDPYKREKHLGIIIEETVRLSKIVDDMLNLSQIQSGFFKLNKKSLNISELLDTAVERYDILSEQSGVKIIRTGSSDAFVEADEARMGQVLYNLISNALHHTPAGGTIFVALKEDIEKIRVEISDTGEGISKDDLPHIWERYYRGEKTQEGKKAGMGLGLAIVKGVLDAHNASYGAESKAAGDFDGKTGTTIWLELKKVIIAK